MAKYRERFQNTGIFENEVYAGIPEMLKNLQSKGYFLALASSKPQIYVERILEHFDLKKYFAVVVGSELDGTRETKDQVVQETLHQLFKENPIEPGRDLWLRKQGRVKGSKSGLHRTIRGRIGKISASRQRGTGEQQSRQ